MKKIGFLAVFIATFFATSCILIVDMDEQWVFHDEVFNNYNAKRVDLGPGRNNHLAVQIPVNLSSSVRNYSIFFSYTVREARLTLFPDDRNIRVFLFTAHDYQNWRNTGEVSRNALYNANALLRSENTFSANIFSSDTYVLVFSNENSITAIMDTEITIRQRFEQLE